MTLKTKQDLFHPLEISICGYSGTGKTTLVTKLINRFSKHLCVGYIKHDAHHFEIDIEGKDTYLAKEAGAMHVAISSTEKTALISGNIADQMHLKQNYIDSDVVFIEGYKESLANKIMLWSGSDKDHLLLEKYLTGPDKNLLAIVGSSSVGPTTRVPYFQRDDIDGIFQLIDHFWKEKFSLRPLYGLVLTGGKSSRMGSDKGNLEYHGKSQVSYLYELLEGITEKTFVSCREDQSGQPYIKDFPKIEDKYLGFGPTGGILSAFHLYPDASWLVLACDMPFVNEAVIEELIEKRNPYKMASCFYNGEMKWPEPLCAIYEPKAAQKLGFYLAMGKPCPRKVLMNSRIELLDPPNGRVLKNANTPHDLKVMKNALMGDKREH